jgi:hypothetical protein
MEEEYGRDLYTDINEFKKSYQLRTMLGQNDNGALPADSHSIVNRCKKSFLSAMELIQTGWL